MAKLRRHRSSRHAQSARCAQWSVQVVLALSPFVMLSGVSALIRHCAIHVLSGLAGRTQLWPLRDHWADNSRGRSAPTPSLVCHFELDAPLRADPVAWEDYQDEIALWDALSGDGLEHEIAWYPQRE